MKKIFLAFFATVLLFLSACGGGDPVVYMSGFTINEDETEINANYWKGEEVSNLPPSDVAIANSIFADSDFTYISGAYDLDTGFKACYWTGDGTKVALTAPGGAASIATDIYVDGSDIYVSGVYNSGNDGSGYWKNKVFKILEDTADSYVSSIYVKDGIVYAAGMVEDKAVYWKGTTKYELSTNMSFATSIEVSESGVVYVAGFDDGKAVYWKDKTLVVLTDGATFGFASSLDVVGEDVYVAGVYGDDFENLAYWKNNAAGKVDLEITAPYVFGGPPVLNFFNIWGPSIQTDGTTVYVSSYLVEDPDDEPMFVGGLWKDGELTVKEGYSYSSLFVRW